jgi:hypothetical protein
MCAANLSSGGFPERFFNAENAKSAEKIRGEEETAFEGDYMDYWITWTTTYLFLIYLIP